MDYSIEINGFHGTDQKAAQAIEHEKIYKSNHGPHHWLGQGIYFFREDMDQAMTWAWQQTKQKDYAAVLFTKIIVNNSSFLNLNTRGDVHILKTFITELKQTYEIPAYANDVYRNNKLRCFIIDLLPDTIKAVQMNFDISKQPKFVLDSSEMGKMDIKIQSAQVCVRDPSVIDKQSIKIIDSKRKIRKRPRVNIRMDNKGE